MNIEQALKLLETEHSIAEHLEYVEDPVAFSLYKVWKMADNDRKSKKRLKKLKELEE